MANDETAGERLLRAFTERESRFESALKEFKAEMRAETAKVEATAQKIENSVHTIDKNLTTLEAANLPQKIDRLEAKQEKQDDRIRALENWRFYILGGLAVLGVVVTLMSAILIKKLF